MISEHDVVSITHTQVIKMHHWHLSEGEVCMRIFETGRLKSVANIKKMAQALIEVERIDGSGKVPLNTWLLMPDPNYGEGFL